MDISVPESVSAARRASSSRLDAAVTANRSSNVSASVSATGVPVPLIINTNQVGLAMDISVPGCANDLLIKDAVDSILNKGNKSPAADGHVNNLHSTLKSMEEAAEVNKADKTEDAAAAPLLHKHHQSLTAQSAADNTNEDVDMSPTSKSPSLIGPCHSIEEASVNTTIESVTMEEAGNNKQKDALPDNTSMLDAPPSHEDVAPSVIADAAADETGQSAHQNVKISLTPEEERLFQLLTSSAEAYEANQLTIDPNPPQQKISARGGFTKQTSSSSVDGASWLKPPPKVERIEIRVAGGWVRDKLLNQHSVDVDVALDCMMGVQFARIVQSYLALQDQEKEEEMKKTMMLEGETGVNGVSEMKKIEAIDNEENTEQSPPKKKGKSHNPHAQQKKQKQKSKQPKIGVIGANPSQSKHLETATMNIQGIDVDFVNLRAEEVYESNSRIPTSKTRMFGSPLEDALRRDFTINSLFYNIRSHRIEDWTGRGLDDLLLYRRIVTPVDAHETFHDDPLRVLRAIRFCVRLDFSTLDEQIREAAMSKRVHHSLHVKVSRERVGKELEGMLTGKHARPGRALDMIADLHLAGSVFAFPGSFPGDHDYASGPVSGHILGVEYNCSLGMADPCSRDEAIEEAARQRARGWGESKRLLSVLPTVMEGHVDEREKILREKTEQGGEVEDDGSGAMLLPTTVNERLLHLCVFILPFHNLTFPDKKGKVVSVTAQMIKESLKFPVRDIQAVSKILSHVDEMATILSEVRSQLAAAQSTQEEGDGETPFQLTPPCRLRAGLLLRALKEHWVTCLLTAAAWEIRSQQRLDEQDAQGTTATSIPDDQPSREFYRAIVDDLDLDECWRVPPHLNGKEIIKELSLPKGPLVGVYLDDQIRWMLLNPEGAKEQCRTHLQERKREREQECSGDGEEVVGEGKMVVDDQNEVNVGVAIGDGQSSAITEGENGAKHFSKKIRSEN